MDSEVSTRVTTVGPRPARRSAASLLVLYPPESPLYAHRIDLQGALTIGRGGDNDVVLDSDTVSRRHCRLELNERGCDLVDCGSKNGTYVGDVEIRRRRLAPGDQIRIGTTMLKYLAGDDVELQFLETAHRMAIEDPLTKLPNRRAFDQAISRELSRVHRRGAPLSLALLDADRFKAVNDGFGHIVGDFVLSELAATLMDQVRAGDLLARLGGEELALLLPDTALDEAVTLCERLRRAVSEHVFSSSKGRVPVSVSIGVAQFELATAEAPSDAERLFDAADRALYAAKRGGRNQVHPPPLHA